MTSPSLPPAELPLPAEPKKRKIAYREGMVPVVVQKDAERVAQVALTNLEGLVFRRVSRINLTPRTRTKYVLHSPTGEEVLPESKVQSLDSWTWTQRLEMIIRGPYSGFTRASCEPRTPSRHKHKPIMFTRENKCEFDPVALDLKKSSSACDPVASDRDTRSLICGFVAANPEGKLYFTRWMVCSVQFLHFWLLLVDGLDTFRAQISKTDKSHLEGREMVRQYVMGGNKLATNTYLRNLMAYEAHGKAEEFKAMAEATFSVPWGETMCRYSVHIYNFLALVLFYHELPCNLNLPTATLDGKPKNPGPRYVEPLPVPFWDLPIAFNDGKRNYPAFQEVFLKKWKIRTLGEKFRRIPTPPSFLNPREGVRSHPTPLSERPPSSQGVYAWEPKAAPTQIFLEDHEALAERAEPREAPSLGEEEFPPLPPKKVRRGRSASVASSASSETPTEPLSASTEPLSASTEIEVILLGITRSRSSSRTRTRTPLSESDLEVESDESTSSRPPSRPMTPRLEKVEPGSNWYQAAIEDEEMDFDAPLFGGVKVVLPSTL